MTEEKKYSLREMVMAQREAAAQMRCAVLHELDFSEPESPCSECRKRAAQEFALPKVTRPRVLRVDGGEWRLVNGQAQREFQWRLVGFSDWRTADDGWTPTPERVKLWADLLESPTEEVEASE